ncbi:hypothetical protein [Kineosporia babensis]|uniref:Uncharacterized protein n=1 Tax=Kineosporia babensis TaxID=499548 RepID=A0A9X1SXF6_9ACTN|nr:hypothetical protein [Kineosporia babensis]MCD5315774.1 hypothetical protein [Kineosporia babensis]
MALTWPASGGIASQRQRLQDDAAQDGLSGALARGLSWLPLTSLLLVGSGRDVAQHCRG